MDADETAIIEEYGSSLEDLTFNSKPLINVLTMLAEENSKYASSITKLIEERIYKVPQQHKLPSLYLLDSIIKNVGGEYLNLIAQILVKVFVSVFEKGDEKVRRDLYKLRHTWPQYFSVKVLHDVDVNINKIDNGWPITAIPPPSPSIHVNPKFLKKAEVSVPQATVPEVVINDDEKQILLEQQKRLQELQRLQEEQLRLTEQEIQEHQMKRDLILKKQEQERKAFLTQQQQILLSLRLGNNPGEEEINMPKSSSSTEVKPVLTKAETTKSSQGTINNRDPRLRHKDQTPSNNNNDKPQQSRSNLRSARKEEQSKPIEPVHKELDIFRGNRSTGRSRDEGMNQSSDEAHGTKRRSRSQSPFDGRGKKFQRSDRDTRPDSERNARPREDIRTKRRRSLEDEKNIDSKRERNDRQGPGNRNFRGRGFSGRGREWNGRSERESKPDFERSAKNFEGKGGRGRDEKPKLRFKRRQPLEREQHNQPKPSEKAGEPGPQPTPQPTHGKDMTQDDLRPRLQPKPLLPNTDIGLINLKEVEEVPRNDPEFATVPQELTLEHKGVILEEAKRRLDLGLISQDQYIELIDKLAEFYELQRKQELEDSQQFTDVQSSEEEPQQLPTEHRPPKFEHQRNENLRGREKERERERKGPARNNGPRMEGPRHAHRDGPVRRGPRMEEPWRREGHEMMGGRGRMNRPPVRMEGMDGPDSFEGPPRPGRRVLMDDRHLIDERLEPHRMIRGPPRREGSPLMDLPGPPNENGPWRTVEHERVPPLHDLGPNHHRFPEGPHPMDEGHPGPFLPQDRDPRDFRGPPIEEFHGGPPRAFEEPFPGEPHHLPDMVPIGHGRPVEHFQGHPVGPGHHGPPHEPIPHGAPHEPPHHGPPHEPLPHGAPHEPSQHAPLPHGPPPHGPTMHPVHLSGSPLRQGTGTPPPLPDPPTPSRMDKKTVDDLFSRLVHAGIIQVTEERIADTPPRIATPPTSIPLQPIHPGQPIPVSQPGHMIPRQQLPLPVPQPLPPTSQVLVQPLPTQVVPVVSQASTSLNLLQKMIEKSKEAATKIPQIDLKDVDDLRKRHIGIINILYEGTQCSSCGLRFAGEAAAFYREHLDWHFRRNRREKDGRRIAHKQWYIPLKDWLDYEEITDPEEKAHSSFFDSEKPENDTNENKNQETDGSCPVLPSDTEAETKCNVCQEKFDLFWDEANEEWRYKDAVRINGKTYHDLCYQDAKSTHVEETDPEAEVNTSKDAIEEPPKADKEEEDPEDKKAKPDTKEDQSSVEIKQESKESENGTKEDSVSKEDEVLDKENVLSKEKVVEDGDKVKDPSEQSTEESAEEIKDEKNKNLDDTGSISVKEEKNPATEK